MKLKQTSLGFMATLLLTTVTMILFPPYAQAESEGQKNQDSEVKVTIGHSFISLNRDRRTAGRVRIVSYKGKNYLEFDTAFSTLNSPKLKVILYRDNSVPKSVQDQKYISLAPLKNFEGKQRYLIPEIIDLRNYASVAIWKAERNDTLAYAALPKITATISTGNFVPVELDYPTQGTASIIEEHGKKYLEFDNKFATDDRNDLKVLLYRHNSVSANIKQKEYIKLASLKSCHGKQRYPLPDEIDVREYASVIVWSDRLNRPLGYANL